MLSKRHQTQKNTYFVIPFKLNSRITNLICSDKKQVNDGLEQEGMFSGNGNVLYNMIAVVCDMTVYIQKNSQNYILKINETYVSKFYLNEKKKKR